MNGFLLGDGVGSEEIEEELALASRALPPVGARSGRGGLGGSVGRVALEVVEGDDGDFEAGAVVFVVDGGGVVGDGVVGLAFVVGEGRHVGLDAGRVVAAVGDGVDDGVALVGAGVDAVGLPDVDVIAGPEEVVHFVFFFQLGVDQVVVIVEVQAIAVAIAIVIAVVVVVVVAQVVVAGETSFPGRRGSGIVVTREGPSENASSADGTRRFWTVGLSAIVPGTAPSRKQTPSTLLGIFIPLSLSFSCVAILRHGRVPRLGNLPPVHVPTTRPPVVVEGIRPHSRFIREAHTRGGGDVAADGVGAQSEEVFFRGGGFVDDFHFSGVVIVEGEFLKVVVVVEVVVEARDEGIVGSGSGSAGGRRWTRFEDAQRVILLG